MKYQTIQYYWCILRSNGLWLLTVSDWQICFRIYYVVVAVDCFIVLADSQVQPNRRMQKQPHKMHLFVVGVNFMVNNILMDYVRVCMQLSKTSL